MRRSNIKIHLIVDISCYIVRYIEGGAFMTSNAQKKANKTYRNRLKANGYATYSITGLVADKELVKNLVKRLSTNDNQALELREIVKEQLADKNDGQAIGGFWELLRNAPEGIRDLDLTRENPPPREINF